MPTLRISENKVIIPSSMLHLENGDTLEITQNNDRTFTLSPKKRADKKNGSFMEILEQVKQHNHKSFNSVQEIDDFIRNERDSWE